MYYALCLQLNGNLVSFFAHKINLSVAVPRVEMFIRDDLALLLAYLAKEQLLVNED